MVVMSDVRVWPGVRLRCKISLENEAPTRNHTTIADNDAVAYADYGVFAKGSITRICSYFPCFVDPITSERVGHN